MWQAELDYIYEIDGRISESGRDGRYCGMDKWCWSTEKHMRKNSRFLRRAPCFAAVNGINWRERDAETGNADAMMDY